jgi:hypothetical protein
MSHDFQKSRFPFIIFPCMPFLATKKMLSRVLQNLLGTLYKIPIFFTQAIATLTSTAWSFNTLLGVLYSGHKFNY